MPATQLICLPNAESRGLEPHGRNAADRFQDGSRVPHGFTFQVADPGLEPGDLAEREFGSLVSTYSTIQPCYGSRTPAVTQDT